MPPPIMYSDQQRPGSRSLGRPRAGSGRTLGSLSSSFEKDEAPGICEHPRRPVFTRWLTASLQKQLPCRVDTNGEDRSNSFRFANFGSDSQNGRIGPPGSESGNSAIVAVKPQAGVCDPGHCDSPAAKPGWKEVENSGQVRSCWLTGTSALIRLPGKRRSDHPGEIPHDAQN